MSPSARGSRHDYSEQAARYDRTRGASPSILEPLERALSGVVPGRLLDVAGGTGNYAAALAAGGWTATVFDVSSEMLAHATAKGLTVVRAEAALLPVGDAMVDAVINISALHLMPDWRAALEPDGSFARAARSRSSPTRVRTSTCIGSSSTFRPPAGGPTKNTNPCPRSSPSFQVRALSRSSSPTSATQALRAGLQRLERDLAAGRRPEEEVTPLRARWGDGTIISWSKP